MMKRKTRNEILTHIALIIIVLAVMVKMLLGFLVEPEILVGYAGGH